MSVKLNSLKKLNETPRHGTEMVQTDIQVMQMCSERGCHKLTVGGYGTRGWEMKIQVGC